MTKRDGSMTLGFMVNRVVPAPARQGEAPKSIPAYDIEAARVEITALDYEDVGEVLPQGHFESDGNLAEWLDDGE